MRRTLDPDTRESTLKRSMRRRTRTAPLITPFTCREREGQVGKLYFARYTSHSVPYFLPLVGCLSVCITRRGSDSATHGRPVPTPWLICSSLSSDYTL